MLVLLELIFWLLGAICTLIILVDAFRSSVLKGCISFFCCFYYFWYALFEFKHENKFLIVLGSFVGGGVGGLLHYHGHHW